MCEEERFNYAHELNVNDTFLLFNQLVFVLLLFISCLDE